MTDKFEKNLTFLEVKECKICNSKFSKAVLDNIKDDVSKALDYSGSVFQCMDCGHAFLSPVLAPNDIHYAYKGYYTQSRENLEISSNAKYDRFSVFKDFYDYRFRRVNSYRGMWIWVISCVIPFVNFLFVTCL